MSVDLNKPAFRIFPEMANRITKGLCSMCGGPIGTFRDELSEKEYHISGMCQKCQDDIFN